MKPEHQKIYIQLKAEIIKLWHDINNKGMFIDGYCPKLATKKAESDLKYSLVSGWWDLTIDEMLLLSPEECCLIREERIKEKVLRFVKENAD